MFTINLMHISLEVWGSIFCACCIVVLVMGRKYEPRRTNLLTVLLTIVIIQLTNDSLAWAYRGDETVMGFYMVRISNFIVFAMNYPLVLAVNVYVDECIRSHGNETDGVCTKIIAAICAVGLTVLVISQFTGLYYSFDAANIYHRESMYWLSVVFVMVPMAIVLFNIIANKNRMARIEYIPFLSFIVLPITATIIQTLHYGLSLANIATATSIIFMFMTNEVEKTRRLSEQEKRIIEQELEMANKNAEIAESKQQIIISQIQPHFLYNSLATISHLCKKDAMLAKKATDSFADYLRMNLDSMRGDTIVPFEKELKHTETYLWLEQLRFGDDLKVEYDIQVDDFDVPPLILQPIAENAVKHGICGTEDGGTVKISTLPKENGIEIIVQDDGCGFEVGSKPADGRSHIGIENVGARIESQCGGTLTIESAPGKGTKAIIFIPGRKRNEHTDS